MLRFAVDAHINGELIAYMGLREELSTTCLPNHRLWLPVGAKEKQRERARSLAFMGN